MHFRPGHSGAVRVGDMADQGAIKDLGAGGWDRHEADR